MILLMGLYIFIKVFLSPEIAHLFISIDDNKKNMDSFLIFSKKFKFLKGKVKIIKPIKNRIIKNRIIMRGIIWLMRGKNCRK